MENRRIKVCHLTIASQNAIPRTIRECYGTDKKRIQTFIIAPGDSFSMDETEFIGVEKPKSRLFRLLFTDRQVYKKARGVNADIYQIHDPELLRFATRLKAKGSSVIFDSTEFYSLQIMEKKYIPKFFRSLVSKLYYFFETRVCHKIDAVIEVCTVENKSYFECRAKKILTLPNYPLLSFFYNNNIKKTYESRDGGIAYFGTLSESRGISVLIESIKYCNIKTVLGGAFVSEDYKNEILTNQISELIDYVGMVDWERMSLYLQNAQLGYACLKRVGQYSKCDTISTKAFEMMSFEIPIILLRTEYAQKINAKYNCFYLVDDCTEENIETAIRFLLDNKSISKKMGQNGRRAVLEEFNWERNEDKLIDLYIQLSKKEVLK